MQSLIFKCVPWYIFARTEKSYETFSQFFIFKTFIVTICDIFGFLLFEACFINKNHILWKSDSPDSTVLALNNLSCSLFSIRSVHEGNTRKRCEICSKLTIKTPELRQRSLSGVFIVNFEHISHLFLVFLLLTLNKYVLGGRSFIVMLYL